MLTVPCGSQGLTDTYTQRLQAATQEADAGDFSAAEADSRAAIALDATRAAGWYELGSILGQTGDFSQAETALRQAIQLQPDLAKAHFSLALTMVADPRTKQDWQGAIAECREALKRQPAYPEALNLLGAGLIQTGQVEDAIANLRHALQIAPALSQAHFNLAMALESRGDLDEASDEYRRAIATKQDHYAEASSQFGKLLLRMGKKEEAERQLTTALCLNPDLLDAHYTLARLLRTSRGAEEAEVEFAEAKELGERPQNGIRSAELSNRAMSLAKDGDRKGAADSLREAIRLKPEYSVPHYNLGLLLADSGDLPSAIHELSKAISLTPGQAKMWFDLGRVLLVAGDREGAIHAIAWAARLSPSDPAIQAELLDLQATDSDKGRMEKPDVGAKADTAANHTTYAAKLSGSGDTMGAVGELLRALTLQPAMVEARRALAHAYEQIESTDSAIQENYKILRCNPEDAATHAALGRELLSQGKAREAVKQLKLALEIEPKSKEARSSLHTAERRLTQ